VSKDSKAQAQYTAVAMKASERCGLCKYYIKFDHLVGMCDKVEGEVRGAGWCKHFEKD
jgi:hypothetical protein